MDAYKISNGFSLIELIIVIVILGIISLIVIERWPGQSIELDGIAHQVAGDIHYTQTLAMTNNQRYCLKFGSTTYAIFNSNNVTVAHPASNTHNIALPGIAFTKPPTPDCIAFNGKGTPYNCDANQNCTAYGTILSGNRTIRLQAGTEVKDITVTHQTGYVYVP